jgi:Bacterial archaeo-eukaryotic release factor family 3
MQKNILNDLLKAKGETCISIIIPTHHYSHERRGDKIELKKAIHDAKAELRRHATPEQFNSYETVVDEWVKKIDYTRNLEGLGMFLSPSVKTMFKFPFPIKEKIVVSDSFEVRDVAYAAAFSEPYLVLLLSEKDVRLLRGSLDELTEVKDENFPDKYEDTHEYSRPQRSSSHNMQAHSMEGDKSVIEDKRMVQFFKVIDKRLNKYLVGKMPLIVIAPKEEIPVFKEESAHRDNIVCTIKGNYNYMNAAQLSERVFPEFVNYIRSRTRQLIQEFEESVGLNLGIEGISNIWKAVKAGRGMKLVVEKDFTHEGFLQTGENRLLLKEPEGAHKVIVDVIDDIIETTISKGGEVYFTDNGQLKGYGKMFLIMRY